MNKPYVLISLSNKINISSEEALKLEIKLNLNSFSKKWKKLGNVLFNWRNDPEYFIIHQQPFYLISEQQFEWIYTTLSTLN